MHILFVTPYPPYPPESGGKIRTYNLVREVAKRHQVTLFTIADAGDADEMVEHLSSFVSAIEIYTPEPMSRWQRWRHPDIYRHFHSPALMKRVADVLESGGIDLVHVEELVLSKVLPKTTVPHVLGRQKIDMYFLKQVYETDGRIRKFRWQSDLVKLLRQEKRARRAFDGQVLCSKVDLVRLSAVTGEIRHCIAPNGVDLDYFAPAPAQSERRTLVFTGSMDYEPNVDAATFFVEDIWPRIRAEAPDVEAYFVGHRPTPEVLALGSHDGIHITGSVDDVRPYIRDASVVICPIRIGEGTRLKILEAMSMQKPVIATPTGAEGLKVRDGQDIRLAKTADAFAATTLELLADPAAAARLAEAGRAVAESTYGWPAIGAKLCDFYAELAAGASRP